MQGANVDSWETPAGLVVHASHVFGLGLVERECARKPRKNVFLSPLSTFIAVAMIQSATGGRTKAGVRKAMALPALAGDDAINEL